MGTNNSFHQCNSSNKIFEVCRRSMNQAQILGKSGREAEAGEIFQMLRHCQLIGAEGCPNNCECDRRLSRLEHALGKPESVLVDWDTMSRRNDLGLTVNGHMIKTGFEEVISTQDQWGNACWHQRISSDIVYKYENRAMRTLLQQWKSLDKPKLDDFDMRRLDEESILPWLHVFEFQSDGRTRIKKFAPNMVPLSGRDHTNTLIQDYELPKFVKIQEQLQGNLIADGQPYYGYSARRRGLAHGQAVAAMRRLEIPYFDGDKIAGSLVYLQPHL